MGEDNTDEGIGDGEMKVWVVMGNDFPDAVFKSEAAAEKYCADKKAANHKDRQSGHGRMIYWRSYDFDLRDAE
jgi:hypothetical protein